MLGLRDSRVRRLAPAYARAYLVHWHRRCDIDSQPKRRRSLETGCDILETRRPICQLSVPPSSFPIHCSRKRPRLSCESIPPICSLTIPFECTCSRLSRAVSKNCVSTLNSFTYPPHSHDFDVIKKFSSKN